MVDVVGSVVRVTIPIGNYKRDYTIRYSHVFVVNSNFSRPQHVHTESLMFD